MVIVLSSEVNWLSSLLDVSRMLGLPNLGIDIEVRLAHLSRGKRKKCEDDKVFQVLGNHN